MRSAEKILQTFPRAGNRVAGAKRNPWHARENSYKQNHGLFLIGLKYSLFAAIGWSVKFSGT